MSKFTEVSRLFDLTGKVAVVTGGACGLGKGVALLLADAGAEIAILDRDFEGAESVAAQIGGRAYAVEADIAEEAQVQAAYEKIAGHFGTVDILINNAGIYPRYPFDTLTEAQWQDMQRVNVWGNFTVMREAIKIMRAKGQGGRIINISSIGSERFTVHDQYAYYASKAALDATTFAAAVEFAPYNILVNSVLPGAIQALDPKPKPPGYTPVRGAMSEPGRILLGRMGLAEELAGPILMLVSAAGGYITGQNIIVDGGFSVS